MGRKFSTSGRAHLRSRKSEILFDAFLFFFPLSSTRRHLGSPRRSVSLSFLPDPVVVSVELSDWWRRKRDSATRIYVFTLFTKDGNLMRFMRKIFFQAWGRKFVIQFRRDFCANNKKNFIDFV